MGPLPVRIIGPVGTRVAADHTEIDGRLLASAGFEDLADSLDHPVEWGWRNRPSAEYLRWRLASPNTAPYHLHLSDDLVAVSVASHLGPAPAAVVLKLLPRRPVAPGRRLDAGPLTRSIISHHRAAFGVYAGFNARVRLRGVQPPRRLQPAPLNLIFRPLPGAIPAESFRLETYEFLDMDAY